MEAEAEVPMAGGTVLLAGGGLETALAVGASWFWASPGAGIDMAMMAVAFQPLRARV